MKKYALPSAAACLAILIILATPGKDSFRLSASETMEKLRTREHLISMEEAKELQEDRGCILVNLDGMDRVQDAELTDMFDLPAEKLNVKSIHRFFRKPGTYVLVSADATLSSQVWVLLTQMGFEHVLVATFP